MSLLQLAVGVKKSLHQWSVRIVNALMSLEGMVHHIDVIGRNGAIALVVVGRNRTPALLSVVIGRTGAPAFVYISL